MPRIGFEGGNTPFYLKMPCEPYYRAQHLRREYPPLSLLQLQRMIDLGRVDPDEPIDLNTVCNTKLYKLDPWSKEYGINLTDEGADIFTTPVNIEVQWTSEACIAAIERVGGVITTRYYDNISVQALTDALAFFKKGIPIPRCALPPQDAVEYYTDPKFRGYLADPEKIVEERFKLAQKYGYKLPDLSQSPKYEMLLKRKDPRQIFWGLNPGWVICLKDKVVLKPKDAEYLEYYKS